MSRSGWRPHIEYLRCLDLKRMMATGAIRPHSFGTGSWVWTDSETGERRASIGYCADVGGTGGNLRLQYTIGSGDEQESKDYNVRLSSVPLHYGGRRWYLHCPATGRRVLKLYLVQGTFVARTAIRPIPTYRCQRVSGLDRIMDQRWRLRRRMGDKYSDLCGEPFKPKGMHWKTFQRFAERDEDLATLENWHFCRRFGMLAERLGINV